MIHLYTNIVVVPAQTSAIKNDPERGPIPSIFRLREELSYFFANRFILENESSKKNET